MRAQIIILIISAATKLCGAEVKPVVAFMPNWRIILLYESVTLSCNLGSKAQENPRYYWTKDSKLLSYHQQTIQIESSLEEDTGTYQCWTNRGFKSDPVRLDVVNSHLILQIPPVIYIGEPLTLRCHTFSTHQKTNTTFFKNKTAIHFSVNDNELRFTSVGLNVAGIYHCSQQIFIQKKYKMFNATMIVSVQEQPHTSLGGKSSTSPWVLVVALLLLLFAALLIFMCRYKLHFTRCRQLNTITEPERRHYSEEDVCYSYIDMNHISGGIPARNSERHEYSTVYSLITEDRQL
ncbi:low affinity immunoglobulin gamma Fc region receptor III-A-like isoform X2 [Ranitomeya imitator]